MNCVNINMRKIIKIFGSVAVILLYALFLYFQWGFVNRGLFCLEAVLMFLLLAPYAYLFLNRREGWHFIPNVKSLLLNSYYTVVVLLALLPTIIFYYMMCSEAISWRVNNYNGGRLDDEGCAMVAIFANLWTILCLIQYSILGIHVLVSRFFNK